MNNDLAKQRRIQEAAQRALLEASERRKTTTQPSLPPEINGRKGLEPTRFSDWEKKGIICDF